MEAGGGSALSQVAEEDDLRTIRWKPNEQCLQLLLAMGIDRNTAIKGLYYTGNHSAEFAASYVFDNPDMDDELDASLRVDARPASDEEAEEGPHFQMVFVVNGAVELSVGKTASQVAHAAVGLFRRLAGDRRHGNELLLWEEAGEKKVVLLGDDLSHLRHLEKQTLTAGLPTFMIPEARRTEVPPDAVAVLAIFGREEQINEITGQLTLL